MGQANSTHDAETPMIGPDHRRVIAIDGPAGAGKTTVAQTLADELGMVLFDTGALYRAVTLEVLNREIDLDDNVAIARVARDADIRLAPPSMADGRLMDVHLNGTDVTWAIRTPAVDAAISKVSAIPEVRAALLETQRRIADGQAVILVGRDIGTVVTPDAGTKIYLDASAEERARRRYLDMQRQGEDIDFAAVLDELRQRDYKDASRATAPLRPADDAVRIMTDGRSVDDIVGEIENIVRHRWAETS